MVVDAHHFSEEGTLVRKQEIDEFEYYPEIGEPNETSQE